MADKAKEYKKFILWMLDDMEEDEQFLKVVYTIIHRHLIQQKEKQAEQ